MLQEYIRFNMDVFFFDCPKSSNFFSAKNTFFDLGFQIFNMVIWKFLTRWLIPLERPWHFEFLKMGNIWAGRIQSWFFEIETQNSHIWLFCIHNNLTLTFLPTYIKEGTQVKGDKGYFWAFESMHLKKENMP